MNVDFAQKQNAAMPAISTDKPYLTPKEVSQAINVSVGTLAVWRATKIYSLPYVKVGSKVLYPVYGLNQWLSSRMHNEQRV